MTSTDAAERRNLNWTPTMLERLRELVATDRTARDIGNEMGGLTPKQITSKVFHMGLKMGRSPGGGTARFWSKERVSRLRELLAHKMTIREAAQELGATVSATQAVMARVGIAATSRPAIFWTDERVAVMRDFAAKGYSGSQIAAQVGDGCSRSGVIIAAKRRGIVLAGRRNVDAPRAPRVGSDAAPRPPKPSRAKPKAKPAPIDNGEPAPLGGWNELAARDECKWIHGDPMRTQWRMCCHPVHGDSSWCAHHWLRCYQPKGSA